MTSKKSENLRTEITSDIQGVIIKIFVTNGCSFQDKKASNDLRDISSFARVTLL